MLDAYADIMALADAQGVEPLWWDNHGVPRFCAPTVPLHLMGRIRCQACRREFLVSLVDGVYGGMFCRRNPNVEVDQGLLDLFTFERPGSGLRMVRPEYSDRHTRQEHVRLVATWHYGDPPGHGCVGDTMNSIPEWEWAEFWPEADPQ